MRALVGIWMSKAKALNGLCDPTAQRLYEKVDKYYYWENCETRNDERIIEDLKAQVEKKSNAPPANCI